MIAAVGSPGSRVPEGDRGLAYGDGLFETFAVAGGVVLARDRHLSRLMLGCRRLRLPPPDMAGLARDLESMAAGMDRGVLRVTLTRGPGGRGYRPPDTPVPTRLLDAHPWPDFPAAHAREGIVTRICDTRLGLNPALAGVKHLNRLEQVLASMELTPDVAEGFMLDTDGRVIEGTRTNVFASVDGVLVTPLLDRCGVSGVMRGLVLDAAIALGWPCAVRALDRATLLRADEVFVTNSLIGLWPVRRLLGTDGAWTAPGPAARGLSAALATAGVVAG